MFRKSSFHRFGIFNLILFLIIFFIAPIQAQQDSNSTDPFAKFGNYTEESDLVIHHVIWDAMLTDSILPIKASTRTMASTKNTASTGTKIRRGSSSPARFESNRVMFDALDDDFLNLVSRYRQELENLPDSFPLEFFSKDEQLAYWLNLHNVVLYEELAKRYPVSKLKKLRNGTKGKPSLWDQKLVTVEGVPLSLNDIQNNILIRHWKSPMVLYGLYQGAIGGPSLPSQAFTGVNVHILLERSAKEFINSNRGIKAWGDKTQVSMIYAWGKAAFPNWERDLGRHLAEYANVSKEASVSQSTGFNPKLYDWSIADTKGGTLSAGPKHSTAASLLTLGRPGEYKDPALSIVLPAQGAGQANPVGNTNLETYFAGNSSRNADITSKGGIAAMLSNLNRNNMIMPGAYSAEMVELLRAVKQKMIEPSEGTVTSEECGTGECPEKTPDGNDNEKDD